MVRVSGRVNLRKHIRKFFKTQYKVVEIPGAGQSYILPTIFRWRCICNK